LEIDPGIGEIVDDPETQAGGLPVSNGDEHSVGTA